METAPPAASFLGELGVCRQTTEVTGSLPITLPTCSQSNIFLLFLKISRGSQVMAVLAVEARMKGGKGASNNLPTDWSIPRGGVVMACCDGDGFDLFFFN